MKRSSGIVGKLIGGVVAVALSVATGVGVVAATSPHNSTVHTDNGCSWDGYHRYDSGFATADTEKKSGNCVEVHVRLFVNGSLVSQDWDATKAVASITGWITFDYSDHNADPLGPPTYVGFRMW
jgi:hypothetical protein